MFTWITFLIGLGALLVAAAILWKRWQEIRLLDPLSIKEEQLRQKRDAVIEQRFERLKNAHVETLKRVGRRVSHHVKTTYQTTYERLQAFESLYQGTKNPMTALAPSVREQIKTLLDEARSLMRDLKWPEAERRLLEVIALDARHPEAFKGLGQIYLKQKLYPQAKETFEFLLKAKKIDDAGYAALAEIAEAEGNLSEAETFRLKAVEANTRHAFRYAELTSFYLNQDQPAKAWPAAKRASDLEPKSAKYLEQALEVTILLGNKPDAKKYFERLRSLLDNQAKQRMWKERIEQMPEKK